MNRYTITAYSAAAGVLITNPISTDAQMVHVNLDPDQLVGPYADLSLDLNGDGIIEIEFDAETFYTASSWGSELHGYSYRGIYIYPTGTFATSDDQIKHLESGDIVEEGLLFNDVDPIFFSAYREFGSGGGWVNIFEGSDWVNNEGCFGIRFQIGAETHYGWVRLELIQTDPGYMPNLYVKDFAYNATPNAPAPINLYYADAATALVLSDVGETNTAEDLQLTFDKAENESSVSQYRVALFTGVTFPTIGEIEALSPDRYIAVEPTGEDISISFDADMLDITGEPVVPGTWYRAIVLSMADGVYAIANDLSAPSNYNFYAVDVAPAVYEVQLQTDSLASDISGFIGTFTMSDVSVSAVRLYITANELGVDELLALDEPYYMEVMPTIGTNTVTFTPDKLIYEAGDPELFESYYLHIVSLPDSVTNSLPALAVASSNFKYSEYPIAPEISIIGYAGNSSDILLQFPHLPNETGLEVYRVFVCKAGTEVDADLVGGLFTTRFEAVYPSGADLHMDLTACNLDTDGDAIVEGQPYVAYVAMRCTCDDYFYCITIPSEEFVLGEPSVGIDDMTKDQLIIANNTIILPQGIAGNTLLVTNASGQLVFECIVQPGVSSIGLPNLPEGVYIAYVDDRSHTYSKKFVVTSSIGY